MNYEEGKKNNTRRMWTYVEWYFSLTDKVGRSFCFFIIGTGNFKICLFN